MEARVMQKDNLSMATMIAERQIDAMEAHEVKITTRDVNVFYGQKQALFDVALDIRDRSVTALIGPSGCGKSTYLRCLNRMNDVIEICRVEGVIELHGQNV